MLKWKGQSTDSLLTRAVISLIKPDKWQAPVQTAKLSARGVTGKDLKLSGTQNVIMTIGPIKCEHRFIVSDLGTPGAGILGVDLLQLVGPSANLDAGCLRIREYKIPLESRDGTVRMSSDKEGMTCSDFKELITPSREHVTPDHSINYLENIESGSAWHAEVHLMELHCSHH